MLTNNYLCSSRLGKNFAEQPIFVAVAAVSVVEAVVEVTTVVSVFVFAAEVAGPAAFDVLVEHCCLHLLLKKKKISSYPKVNLGTREQVRFWSKQVAQQLKLSGKIIIAKF